MVVLNRIYTRTGDDGTTALGTGARLRKDAARIEAYGTVDEANAAIGLARLETTDAALARLDDMLMRIQNDLFDLGADLCVPEEPQGGVAGALRIAPAQVSRIETELDALNEDLAPLRSFVLPGGTRAAAALHLARTVTRRAERRIVTLAGLPGEAVSAPAIHYVNRLSDFLFVASRWANAKSGGGDVLWVPGANR